MESGEEVKSIEGYREEGGWMDGWRDWWMREVNEHSTYRLLWVDRCLAGDGEQAVILGHPAGFTWGSYTAGEWRPPLHQQPTHRHMSRKSPVHMSVEVLFSVFMDDSPNYALMLNKIFFRFSLQHMITLNGMPG